MYEIIRNVIISKRYELSDMLKKIDTIWIQGSITEDERNELIRMAQDNADAQKSYNIMEKLEELDRRMTAIEKQNSTLTSEEYPEYKADKWYYTDNTVTFEGKRYVCIAPEGQVCAWSPSEYPTYWQEVQY